jgi:hypothetical protein
MICCSELVLMSDSGKLLAKLRIKIILSQEFIHRFDRFNMNLSRDRAKFLQ